MSDSIGEGFRPQFDTSRKVGLADHLPLRIDKADLDIRPPDIDPPGVVFHPDFILLRMGVVIADFQTRLLLQLPSDVF